MINYFKKSLRPFNSIRIKLLLSFIFVILLTVAVINFIVFFLPMQARMKNDPHIKGNERDLAVTQNIVDEISKCPNLAKLPEAVADYEKITNNRFKIFNMEGKAVTSSRAAMGMHPPEMDAVNMDLLSKEEWQMLRSGQAVQGTTSKTIRDDIFRIKYIAYPFTLTDGTKLVIMTSHPGGPPMPSTEKVSYLLIQSFLIATIVSVIASVILAWLIVKPIKKMEMAAYNISKGDFSSKMNLKQADELGSLAAAFDSMTTELEKNISGRMKLMGDISHELNTPLAAIRVNTEALLDGVVSSEEDKEKKLNSILNQTIRLSYLVDDLLELAKFETGEVSLLVDAFPVMETVTRAVETAEGIAQKKNDKILVYTENESIKAMGDARRISQVLINLVNNAIHHNPGGIEIKLSISETPDKVVFSVEDNGVGIPKDELDDIFRRFHKVDRSRTRHDSGSGLGLAIVKEIIEAHNTNIKVDSALKKGTKFSFALNKVRE